MMKKEQVVYQKLSQQLFIVPAQPGLQIDQGLVGSSHAAACASRDHLFLSLSVGYQDFGCEHQ